jgi:signal transduction histidine kinase
MRSALSPLVAPKPSIRLAALQVPLAAKLAGANLLVVAVLVAAWRNGGGELGHEALIVIAGVVLLHLALVVVALRPIRDLEHVASRVWSGDYGARVERSMVADNQVLRVGSMFNILLDSLASDRARMRRLAGEVIAVGDRERAAIARELHDSTAQHMAALLFQLSAAARDTTDPALADRLREARDSAEGILEQVRRLSDVVHPGVLDNLGLEAALRKLVRDTSANTAVDFDVRIAARDVRIPRKVEAVLYRVAEEAIRNALRHASAKHVRIVLSARQTVSLEVHDDGRGFDLAAVDRRQRGTGLGTMQERLALVDGWLEINTAPGNGTTVAAHVPLGAAPNLVS